MLPGTIYIDRSKNMYTRLDDSIFLADEKLTKNALNTYVAFREVVGFNGGLQNSGLEIVAAYRESEIKYVIMPGVPNAGRDKEKRKIEKKKR